MIAARGGEEICVCDLTDAFQVKGPTISHHLRVLREAGLIDCERRGTWVYYWVIPAALARLSQLLDTSAIATAAAGWAGPESVERATGIEPAPSVWKTEALPLSYARARRVVWSGRRQDYWPVAAGAQAHRAAYTCRRHGVWRSLVAHSLWERGAVGSNPATPTACDGPSPPVLAVHSDGA